MKDLIDEAWATEDSGLWNFIAAFAVFVLLVLVIFVYTLTLTP